MTLAALAMIGKYDVVNPVGYLSPLLILAIPLFDTSFVMALRLMKGDSPFKGSPDHFVLRLQATGWSVRSAVNMTYVAGFVLGVLALWNLRLNESQSIFLVGGIGATMLLAALAFAKIRMGEAKG